MKIKLPLIKGRTQGCQYHSIFILKVRLWVLRRDQTWIYVSFDISLITKHIFNNDISFKS